mgnify:CR=1 FL=1
MKIADDKKKKGGELSTAEIQFFINGMMKGTIGDYQTAALLMAIYINGNTYTLFHMD